MTEDQLEQEALGWLKCAFIAHHQFKDFFNMIGLN